MAPQRDAGSGAEAELPEYAGQYRLGACLGSGGMGVVHLATSTSGLRLAVKVVHAEFAKDPEFRGRFRQEVAAARRVSGAFTAPVVDADTDSARPWMATLFIPGPTLAEHVKRNGPMPPGQLRRLMAGLAEALRDIHRAGVVHRDLKPSNVLLAEDGPKVIDFGISRPKDSELRTETGKLIGTPPFMAPEQFRRPREVGPAADIFALGSVTVHAATGRGPFDSDSPYVVAYQVVHDEPDLTGVPENLAPLVRACLAKEPEDRPTADQLMHQLRSVSASYDTQSFVPTRRGEGASSGSHAGADWLPGSAVPKGSGAGSDSGAEGAEESEEAGVADSGRRADGGSGGPATGSRGGARLRKRALLVATAVVLVAGGVFASVRWAGGADGGDRTATPRATGALVAAPALEPWATKPTAKKSGAPQCSYGAGKLLCAQPGLVSALNPADGTVLWRHTFTEEDAAGLSEPPATAGGLIHVLTDGERRVQALDPDTGEVRWERDLTAYGSKRYAGGVLLLTSADGTVTGLDGATGDTLWSRRVPGQQEAYFSSFAGDGLAYVVSTPDDPAKAEARTRITAVDPESGDVRWSARLEGYLKPVGVDDGTLVLVAIGGVYADTVAVVRYDPDAKETVRVPLPVRVEQARVGVRGDRVYLLGIGGSLMAVDMGAREQVWRAETGVSRGSAPVADDRHVYFTAADGRLLALDADKGGLSGETPPRLGDADRVAAALPEPVVIDGRICSGAPDGTVFGVDGGDPASW
ncbi:serine/threonine-protein kinase [Streptomyces ipomoeae]|uniref:serine/threonine-protein kinase n=1 Tax=Streptomyces ipomoeae TaxID=103232 RepID=UPI0011473231|nr:serine/threonine-protein kinase [Streptomyces ipomoeae]MDX2939487.1 serine/threonine-protein kinase [Streptomyces ipomoeae]TQE17954.1 serine/threonine protein kinase [Streptomyces ipomoeae]